MIKHYRLLLLSVLSLFATSVAHAEQFSVLLFSKTAGWHHESILEGVKAIRGLGQLHDFNVFWTEDAARVFNDTELKKYKAVIFLSTTGDVLTDEQQAAFERYIKAGGGFVGIHAAADTEYGWPWYTKMVGHMFHIHPAVQTATIGLLAFLGSSTASTSVSVKLNPCSFRSARLDSGAIHSKLHSEHAAVGRKRSPRKRSATSVGAAR